MTEDLATYETYDVENSGGFLKKDVRKEEKNGDKLFKNEFNVESLLTTAGTLELSDTQYDILYKPINEIDIEIRPDGLIYAPWMEYASRLRDAFGASWALVPNGMPKFSTNKIWWGFWLIIKGHLMGFAIGEQEYFPTSATMSYGDACEGAKSNALMRLCKGIGISLELWKPAFIREWKEEYAETYFNEKKQKDLWKKKGEPIPITKKTEMQEPGKKKEPSESYSPEAMKKVITEPQRKRFYAIGKGAGKSDEEMKAYLLTLGIEHSAAIPYDRYEEVCKWAEGKEEKTERTPGEEG